MFSHLSCKATRYSSSNLVSSKSIYQW